MSRRYLIALFLYLVPIVRTQAQGSFDLIAVDLKKQTGKWTLNINSVEKITDRDLYDNQPAFINDKQMAFSAADDKGNHDIIIFNFESRKFTNLTKTADRNEFSPSLTDCGLYVSAVTVEPDGKQRLWLYPTNFGEPRVALRRY
jgi:Tol biopolymer transport system component